MESKYNNIDFHKFVDEELAKTGFRIQNADENFLNTRIDDVLNYMNSILKEYQADYGWPLVDKDYILNPLNNKWKYSFVILDEKDEISFLNFSSVYGNIIHNHCTYARRQSRGRNFAKLHIIKLCQTGLDNGFTHQEGFWPKHNNGSIILFLKMGWKIDSIRNNKELFMIADLFKVRNQTYELVLSGK